MIALVIFLVVLVVLDVLALRFGVSSRDDVPEAVDAEARCRKVLVERVAQGTPGGNRC